MRTARFSALFPAMILSLAVLPLSAQTQAAPTASPPATALPAQAAQPPAKAFPAQVAASRAATDGAEALMKQGKWKSAWAALDAYDPKNADPYALASKIRVCVRGYVQTSQHKAFALVDLQPGQSLEALRAGQGEYEVVSLDPVVAVDALTSAGWAIPAELSSAMGDYYYAAQELFSDNWDLPDEEICTRSLKYYDDAAAGGVSDARSLLHRGELSLRFGDASKSESFLRSALALDPSDPEIHLNLGIALAMAEKGDEAFSEIDRALAGYKDGEHRFNCYLVGARLAAEPNAEKSELYLKAAEAEFPTEPGPSLLRQMIAVELGKPAAAASAADFALDRFPDSPYVVRSIITTWINAEALDPAMAFLDRGLARKAGNDASVGVLSFYKSLLVAQSKGAEGIAEAMSLLDASEACFRKTYAADNQVFQAIAQFRAQLVAAKAQADAAASAAAGAGQVAPSAQPAAPSTGTAPKP
jgi:tetratricopeptide (TPR) repeat protein